MKQIYLKLIKFTHSNHKLLKFISIISTIIKIISLILLNTKPNICVIN